MAIVTEKIKKNILAIVTDFFAKNNDKTTYNVGYILSSETISFLEQNGYSVDNSNKNGSIVKKS